MKEFFKPEEVSNANNDTPWKKSETDRMLNLYFEGTTPDRIAVKLARNPKAVNRRIEAFRDNENERADRYEPVGRYPRKGLRLTENEKIFIKAHKKNGVSIEVTAKVLQRKPAEVGFMGFEQKELGVSGVKTNALNNVLIPPMDLIMALRFAWKKWCQDPRDHWRLPPDADYDRIVHEECEFGGQGKRFLKIKSMDVDDYPFRVRGLACYLIEVEKEKKSDTLNSI